MHVVVMDITGKTYKSEAVFINDILKTGDEETGFEDVTDAVDEFVTGIKNFAASPTVTMTLDREEITFNSANIVWAKVYGIDHLLGQARSHFGVN